MEECPTMSSREAFVVTLSAGIVVTTAVHWLCETYVVKYVKKNDDLRVSLSPRQLHDVALKLARYLYFSVQGLPLIAYLLYTLATTGFAANAYLWANAALYAVAFDVYELGQIRGDPSAALAATRGGTRGSGDFLRIFHHLFELGIVLAMSVGGEVSPYLIFAGCQVVLGNNAFIFPVLVRVRPCTQERQVYYTIASALIAMVPVVFCAGGIITLLAIGAADGSLSALRLITGGLFVAVFVTLDTILFYKYFLPLIRKARAGELVSPPPKGLSRLRSADSTLVPGIDPMLVDSPLSPSVIKKEESISISGDTTLRRPFFGEDTNPEGAHSTSSSDEVAKPVIPVPHAVLTPDREEVEELPQMVAPQPQGQLVNVPPPVTNMTKHNTGSLFGLPSPDTAEDLTYIDGGDTTVIFSDTDEDTTRLSTMPTSSTAEVAMVELDSAQGMEDTEPVITSAAELMLEQGTANNSPASSPYIPHRSSLSSRNSVASVPIVDESKVKGLSRVTSYESMDMSTEVFFNKMEHVDTVTNVNGATVMSTSTLNSTTTSQQDPMQLTSPARLSSVSSVSPTGSIRSLSKHSRSRSNVSLDLERDGSFRSTSSRSRPSIADHEQLSRRGSHVPRKPLVTTPLTMESTCDLSEVVVDAPPAAPVADLEQGSDKDDNEEYPDREFVVSV